MASTSGSGLVRVLPFALALVPPALIASAIGTFGLNVPVQDQWRFAPDLLEHLRGSFDPASAWKPFGPHRILFPKLVMFGLADWTGWDTRAEMWFDFGLMLFTLVLLADLARLTLQEHAPSAWPWIVPWMATSLFTMGAWHSWTLGWMMNLFFAVFGGVFAAWSLGRFGAGPLGVVGGLTGAVLAGYSYLGAMPLFVLLPLAVFVYPRSAGQGWTAALVATVAAAAFIGLYLFGYPTAPASGQLGGLDLDAASMGLWLLRYLGSRFVAWDPDTAVFWGVLAATFALAGLFTAARFPHYRKSLVPWLLLSAYVAAVGMTTAAGRHASPYAPILSRYTLLPALFWAAVPCLIVLCSSAWGWNEWTGALRAVTVVTLLTAIVFAARGYTEDWRLGRGKIEQRAALLEIGAGCLENLRPPDLKCLQLLSRASPRLVVRMSRRMKPLGLGPFQTTGEIASSPDLR